MAASRNGARKRTVTESGLVITHGHVVYEEPEGYQERHYRWEHTKRLREEEAEEEATEALYLADLAEFGEEEAERREQARWDEVEDYRQFMWNLMTGPSHRAPERDTTDEEEDSWAATSIMDLWDTADNDEAENLILLREDGNGLLYPGRVHFFAAEPSSLKSWLALVAAAQELKLGHSVTYYDYEDNKRAMVKRLKAMGVKEYEAELFHYADPGTQASQNALDGMMEEMETWQPSLVVIDGTTEVLARFGFGIDGNTEFTEFLALMPKPIARTGPAVVLIDHVSKNKETRSRGPIGAQHKLAGTDVTYILERVQPLSATAPGIVRVLLNKDKGKDVTKITTVEGGTVSRVADFHVTLNPDGSVTTQVKMPDAATAGAPDRTEALLATMEKVSAYVATHGASPVTVIRQVVGGRSTTVTAAIDALADDGYVTTFKPEGGGPGRMVESVMPYHRARP